MRHDASASSGWSSRRSVWALRGWCLALAAAILGPVLAPGYTLSYDMVFVPDLELGRDALGLGDALPRAVPLDAVVAVVSSVLPGQLVQKLVLLATLVAAGLGAARLTPTRSTGLRAVAATAYVWNPFVAERLVLGHWALLVAYAVLPWLVLAVIAVRAGVRGAGARAVVLAAVAALTPTGGVLAVLVALPVLLWPGVRRHRLAAVGGVCAVALNAPWWLPGLLHGGGEDGARAGVEAFSARADTALGPVGSLLGLGGVWNAQVVPDSRGTLLGVVATLVFLGLGALGLTDLRRGMAPSAFGGLLVAAGVGLLLAVAAVLPGGTDALAWLVGRVPGAGLLRDGQKWLAPYASLLAPAIALGVGRLAGLVREADLRRLVPVAAVVVLLACLPDLVWGSTGRLRAVDYPAEWSQVRSDLIAARDAGAEGDVLVLPWSAFRAYGWNGDRTVLDPAPRWFPGSVVASDDLVVSRAGANLRVPGGTDRAEAAHAALESDDPEATLARLGIGWVLVERDQPDGGPPVPAGRVVHDGQALRLVRLGEPAPVAARPWPGYAPWVVGTDAAVALGVLLAASLGIARRRRSGTSEASVPNARD